MTFQSKMLGHCPVLKRAIVIVIFCIPDIVFVLSSKAE
jgi:hypothetical protein